MTMDIEKFNPKIVFSDQVYTPSFRREELSLLVDKYKDLVIAGVDDKEGYDAVDLARKDLKKTRVEIQKQGKAYRAEALQFQKNVIALEKELVGKIEPLENDLEEKQKAIDDERERLSRIALLPERRERLEKICTSVSDDEILKMDTDSFDDFCREKHSEYLAKIEREQQEEKRRIEDEKRSLEEEKRREMERKESAEKARKEAEEKARRDAEEARRRHEMELETLRLQAEREKEEMRLKAEREKREEAERIVREEREKKEAEEKALEDKKREEERARKNKLYTEWAGQFENDDDVTIRRDGDDFVAYKELSRITIK